MDCNFTVGQKVVCIANGDWWGQRSYIMRIYGQTFTTPKRGDILTIREIYFDESHSPGGVVGLRFMEIRNPIHPTLNIEYGFLHHEFAPLTERKTDISVFTKLLQPELV